MTFSPICHLQDIIITILLSFSLSSLCCLRTLLRQLQSHFCPPNDLCELRRPYSVDSLFQLDTNLSCSSVLLGSLGVPGLLSWGRLIADDRYVDLPQAGILSACQPSFRPYLIATANRAKPLYPFHIEHQGL